MNIRLIKQPFQLAIVITFVLAVVGALILTDKAIRLSNIQSCLNLAQNHTTTKGNSEKSEWSVSEVSISNSIYQECVSKKYL